MRFGFRPLIAAAAAIQTAALASAMRLHHVRTFRDKFHQLSFEGAVGPHKQKYVRVYRGCGKRERRRRFFQDAHFNQLNSHKPGTVQPHHIFGTQL